MFPSVVGSLYLLLGADNALKEDFNRDLHMAENLIYLAKYFFNRTPPAITENAITKNKQTCFILRASPGSAITRLLL